MRWLDSITDLMKMRLGEPRVLVMDREAWSASVYGLTKNQTQVSNLTEHIYTHTHTHTNLE